MVGRVADRAAQIHGCAGYIAEYAVERFYRDVRLFRLYEGTIDWVIGDRTGAGGFGSRSITAVIWPPERRPVFVAFYITEIASFE